MSLPTAPQSETAHVLFMDLVEYSEKSMEEQPRLIGQLQVLLRGTEELRRAQACDEVICLPTGDGMALVFFRDSEAPARCAVEVARTLPCFPDLRLRMGIHTGPVYRVQDITSKENVAGAAINYAQRVMDCGEAGHILVSGGAAEFLLQFRHWADVLHDLGECEVKHGRRVRVFSLHGPELGNQELPRKLRRAEAQTQPRATPAAQPDTGADAGRRVAILYRRHVHPDEDVLRLLETQLKAHGFRVFIDRHLSVGVEWAREIERQVTLADAVVPLISGASIQSDMLDHELRTAHQASQRQDGRPRLLPVRVNYTGPLPDSMAAILDPLEYALWETPRDDARLVEELVRSLLSPEGDEGAALRRAPAAPTLPLADLEAVGGAVPLSSRFYVTRESDEQFLNALSRCDSIVLVKGARQMGKTSLLARGVQHARGSGARVLFTDLQRMGEANLSSCGAFVMALAESLADQLDLDELPDRGGNELWGPTVNLERYLRRVVLRKIEGRLVWNLDEIDRLFSCPFGSEIFALFRSWHNARAVDPDGPWSRLTLAIAYATEAHLFITDINQSPFNVGTRIALADFTPEQVRDLNERHGSPLRSPEALDRFHNLVNGHPYLTRRGLHELAARGMTAESFELEASRDEGPYGDHLRRILVLLAQDETLLEIMRGVLRGQECTSMEAFYRLRSAGVLAGDSVRDAHLRCRLYAAYLGRHLL